MTNYYTEIRNLLDARYREASCFGDFDEAMENIGDYYVEHMGGPVGWRTTILYEPTNQAVYTRLDWKPEADHFDNEHMTAFRLILSAAKPADPTTIGE